MKILNNLSLIESQYDRLIITDWTKVFDKKILESPPRRLDFANICCKRKKLRMIYSLRIYEGIQNHPHILNLLYAAANNKLSISHIYFYHFFKSIIH